jgi:hypothetical protein
VGGMVIMFLTLMRLEEERNPHGIDKMTDTALPMTATTITTITTATIVVDMKEGVAEMIESIEVGAAVGSGGGTVTGLDTIEAGVQGGTEIVMIGGHKVCFYMYHSKQSLINQPHFELIRSS